MTGFFLPFFFLFSDAVVDFFYSVIEKDLKYNKRYMKTWRSPVLVMRAHETKTKYTILSINTCKIFLQPLDVEEPNIFNGSILSKSPSQSKGCLMSENAPSPLPALKTES